MAWLKSFCASALQEVSKLTFPSVLSSAAACCTSARPVESATVIARVVLIALLHLFGRFDFAKPGANEREVLSEKRGFIAGLPMAAKRNRRQAGRFQAGPMRVISSSPRRWILAVVPAQARSCCRPRER